MKTPIHDFVKAYLDLRPARFHMPGHKGRGPLGCEVLDLTEIPGADSLYEASGIIAQSEANASRLFGCPTFYSTEGSSHCIRAMLLLAREACQGIKDQGSGIRERGEFRVLAARNVHKAFLTAAALLDLDVRWLPLSQGSYLSAQPTPETLAAALEETGAQAVYLSCPDYLGFLPDLRPLAELCHARGALLLVDNAHGAYLRFLSPSRHPMDLGADLCCDSAHKTLPVLTGGAYLHVKGSGIRDQGSGDGGNPAPACRDGSQPSAPPDEATGNRQQATGDGGDGFLAALGMTGREARAVRDALGLFGSTSPSYLILQSLDLANPYLEALPEKLAAFLPKVEALKTRLRAAGWRVVGDEPLKLTLCTGDRSTGPSAPLRSAQDDKTGSPVPGAGGQWPPLRAQASPVFSLEQERIFCEFADPDFVVFMLSPNNTDEELERLEAALLRRETGTGDADCRDQWAHRSRNDRTGGPAPGAGGQWPPLRVLPEAVCTLREAMLRPAELVPAGESLGRVLARPGVSCPPAVPILMPGERIDEAALASFRRYGMERVAVLP